MRLNKYIAQSTGISRRSADAAISNGRVEVNGALAQPGQDVSDHDEVSVDSKRIAKPSTQYTTIMLHKPTGYVCSRDGQGSNTVYDLLPDVFHSLKPVGRLDKDSTGLLLLTDDGMLAQQLTHPSHQKQKHYVVTLDKPLSYSDFDTITSTGVKLTDGISRLELDPIVAGLYDFEVVMHEGRNRQIRRTFAALGYEVTRLHRTDFGEYHLGQLPEGRYTKVVHG